MVKVDLVTLLGPRKRFFQLVDQYNLKYRAGVHSKTLYMTMVDKYRHTSNYPSIFVGDSYLRLAYDTLHEWNMNQRGAKLVGYDKFASSVRNNTRNLTTLSAYRFDLLSTHQLPTLFQLISPVFHSLDVMATRARIVGVSKTLHFLLPDLMMPIDRNNVLSLLYLGGRYSSQPTKEFSDLKDVFNAYHALAQNLNLSQADIDGEGWNTSVPKLIDNALIAFVAEITASPIPPTTGSHQPQPPSTALPLPGLL